jgi:hypothetical protein
MESRDRVTRIFVAVQRFENTIKRAVAGPLLGLCWEEFQGQAAVPWNETGFWGLLKETPTAPTMGQRFFSKRLTATNSCAEKLAGFLYEQ